MTRDAWHVTDCGDALTVSRRMPPRFDLCAETRLPQLRRRALAHEVRKDMWRTLRSLRGFAPVVEVTKVEGGLRLRAGGAVAGPVQQDAHDRLSALLICPDRRARWIRHARLHSC